MQPEDVVAFALGNFSTRRTFKGRMKSIRIRLQENMCKLLYLHVISKDA
jgi:hypothetical protein